MEKLYSKSIFSLSSTFLSHTSLTPFDSSSAIPLLPTQQLKEEDIDDDVEDNDHLPSLTPSLIPSLTATSQTNNASTPKLRCNACSITFENARDQHAHYKSLWHTFNLKLRLAGATAITKDEFTDLGEMAGDSSESSSSGESDIEKDVEGGGGKLQQFLKQEAAAAQEGAAGEDNKPRQAKSHKLAFLAQQGGSQMVVSVWRCLLGEDNGGTNALLALQQASNNAKWTILLCSGGRFAGAVFSGNSCVEHKAMHRYTVRKKQGGSQSSRDATGNAPKSAGASLRRYNETRLREDITEILQSWKEHINTSHYVFYFAPKGAPRSMLLFDGSPLQAKDARLRKIPIPIKRPTFLETKYVHQSLSTIEFFRLPDPTSNTAPASDQHAITTQPKTTKKSLKNTEDQNISTSIKDQTNPKTTSTKEKGLAITAPHPPRQEDPIYAPIRAGNLEEMRRLLEADVSYQFSVPATADEVITPLFVACTTKNPEVITYLLSHPITKEEINVTIPSHKFYTPLHFVSSEGDMESVKLLLEAGANPTLKDINSKTAYDIAKNKETRLIMRSFAGKHLDMWDYTLAHIDPLTDADKKDQLKKKAEKMKKKKQAQKQKKETDKKEQEKAEAAEKQRLQTEETKKIEKEAKQVHDMKVKTMTDRERRALAAENRLLASRGISVTCENCKKEIVGVPFERLEFKYCTTKCVADHKKQIGR